MMKKENNYAFIDSQNLNLSINSCGWKIDWQKFRLYLKEKYSVNKAYLFLGYLPNNFLLYRFLKRSNFLIVFKPTFNNLDKTKGNCDAELVLAAVSKIKEYEGAIIISGDGDFHCLVKYLLSQRKLKKLLIPNSANYSCLLKKFPSQYLAFVSDLQKKIEYKKEPREDKTSEGAFYRDNN